jgi:DNA-binding NarL/FixJ family response regulator
LAALHQTAVAEVTLQAALAGALAHGARPAVWQVHAELGTLYHTQGRHAEAARATAAAQTLVEELAATIPTDPLRQQFVRSAAPRLVRPRLGALHRAAKEAVGGLTPREREVAMLVAQGKSNRAIADGLVVSERTVEDHVGNILGKLGYTSRTQIATWAVETGLIRRPLRNAE